MRKDKLKNKKKILVVCSFPSEDKKIFGGITTSCRLFEQNLKFLKLNVIKLDSTQFSNPAPNMIVRSFFATKRLFKYLILISVKNPDSVLLFFSSGMSAYEKAFMGLIAKFFNTKVFLFPRGGKLIDYSKNKPLLLYMLKKANYFFAQGEQWRHYAQTTLKIHKENVYLVPNWTATEDYLNIGKYREVKPINKDNVRILYIGWIEKDKGVFELVKACEILHSHYKNLTLNLLGDGKVRLKVEKYLKERKINYINFHGWANEDQKMKFLSMSDIFVLPSFAEGFPNSLIEAMSSKLACISTPVGNINTFFEDGKDIIFTPVGNISGLVDSIETVIKDESLNFQIVNNAYKKTLENFSTLKGLKFFYKILEENT